MYKFVYPVYTFKDISVAFMSLSKWWAEPAACPQCDSCATRDCFPFRGRTDGCYGLVVCVEPPERVRKEIQRKKREQNKKKPNAISINEEV